MLCERERKGCALFSALGVWPRRLYPILCISVALREGEKERARERENMIECVSVRRKERQSESASFVESLFGIARMVKVTLSYDKVTMCLCLTDLAVLTVCLCLKDNTSVFS